MTATSRPSRRSVVVEALVFCGLAAVGAGWLAASAGALGWSWDALNHHVYLGLLAQQPHRLQTDVVAASFQSYQWPYLYWPVYRLAMLDGGGDPTFGARVAAAWAAALAVSLTLPLWWLARRLLPDAAARAHGDAGDDRRATLAVRIEGLAWRALACSTGLASVVVLTALQTTANDALAAVPLLWALAVMAGDRNGDGPAVLASALWGVSVAFKLSNALFLPLLLWWWWQPGRAARHGRARRALRIGAAASLGFGVLYAPWGWQLWQLTGNPFYPYAVSVFGSLPG